MAKVENTVEEEGVWEDGMYEAFHLEASMPPFTEAYMRLLPGGTSFEKWRKHQQEMSGSAHTRSWKVINEKRGFILCKKVHLKDRIFDQIPVKKGQSKRTWEVIAESSDYTYHMRLSEKYTLVLEAVQTELGFN